MPDYFGWDEEVPAGYQDADLEQAAFEEEGRRLAALHKRGICTHGWQLGGSAVVNRTRAEIEEDRQRGQFPDRPTDASLSCQNDISKGKCLCLDCGIIVDDPLARR